MTHTLYGRLQLPPQWLHVQHADGGESWIDPSWEGAAAVMQARGQVTAITVDETMTNTLMAALERFARAQRSPS